MKLYFSLMAAALIVVAMCGAAMSWDGSYEFMMVLDSQAPYVPQHRWIVLPADWAAILMSRLTDDLGVLQATFGLVYATILLAILATSWWIVRGKAPSLFLWVALGIGIGTLPGQFPIYAEATLVVQLFWPIALAILTQIQVRHVPVVILLATLIILSHPFSVVLFAMAAGLSFMIGLRYRSARRWMWLWACGFIMLVAVSALRFWMMRTEYETEQLSLDVLRETFNLSVAGLPLAALAFGWLAATMAFVAPFVNRLRKGEFVLVVRHVELVSITTAGILLFTWAKDSHLWGYALGFRSWVLFCSLPFIGLAALEALGLGLPLSLPAKAEWVHRSRTILQVAIVFLLVISVQSISWLRLEDRLREIIAQSPGTCISMSSIGWLGGTPLNHWSVTSLSILLQGRSPQKIVLAGHGCVEAEFEKGFPIGGVIWQDWREGWFDMHSLAHRLIIERDRSLSK